MCPAEEMVLREQNRLLHPFEMIPDTRRNKLPKADRSRMVKEYSRPAAGKAEATPASLRPGPVLLRTVQYLLRTVASLPDTSWSKKYEFIFDRLRAVRQDLVVQRIEGFYTVRILEMAVRFYIYSSYVLCEEKSGEFDSHINDVHTQECLKRLLVLYNETDSDKCRENLTEFLSLYLVLNLGNSEALRCGLSWKSRLESSEIFSRCLSLSLAAWLENNVRVFKLARTLPPIHLCAFHRHISKLQSHSFGVMSSGYNSKNLKFNVEDLVKLLWFNSEDECVAFCELHGLSVVKNGVVFSKGSFRQSQSALRKSRVLESNLRDKVASALFESETGDDCAEEQDAA